MFFLSYLSYSHRTCWILKEENGENWHSCSHVVLWHARMKKGKNKCENHQELSTLLEKIDLWTVLIPRNWKGATHKRGFLILYDLNKSLFFPFSNEPAVKTRNNKAHSKILNCSLFSTYFRSISTHFSHILVLFVHFQQSLWNFLLFQSHR